MGKELLMRLRETFNFEFASKMCILVLISSLLAGVIFGAGVWRSAFKGALDNILKCSLWQKMAAARKTQKSLEPS